MTAPPDRLVLALEDRYRLERELGAGGMATVYLAHDVRHDRGVALKVLRPDLAAVLGAERFLYEIKTTANLQHPHILPLHDSGEVDGTGQGRRPVWSPDGGEVAFVRDTLSGGNVHAHRSDGSGQDRLLARLDRPIQGADWSRDGQWLLMRTDDAAEGHGDIVGKRTSGDTAAVPLAATPFEELHPALSRDGRWMAYSSNESGQYEVYVRPFPNAASGRWQVSIGGGAAPRWPPDGNELYYLNGNQLIAARIVTAPTFAVAQRTPLFSVADYDLDFYHQSFEVTPDGRSFLFLASTDRLAHRESTARLVLVNNWFSELKARLAH